MPEQSHFNIVDNCVCTSQNDGNAYQKNENTFTNSIIDSLPFEFMHYLFHNRCMTLDLFGLKARLNFDSHCNKINSHNIAPFRIASLFNQLTIGFIFTVALILFHSDYLPSLVVQRLKCLPAMWETWVWSLGREAPLEKEMATHSSILAWRIPWTEELGGLQSTGRKESDTTERLHLHLHLYLHLTL